MAELDRPWNTIVPLCGCHGDKKIQMTVNEYGSYSVFYSCPKYYPQNREEGERACSNRINLVEYEKMVDHISKEIADAMMNLGSADLTNHKWKKKDIEYTVLSQESDRIEVSIVNKRALR